MGNKKHFRIFGWVLLIVICSVIALTGILGYKGLLNFSFMAIKGDGNIITKNYSVKDINAFEIDRMNLTGDGVKITFISGDEEGITVETDSNLINDEFTANYSDSKRFKLSGTWFKRYSPSIMNVTVTAKSLKQINIGGSAVVKYDNITTDTVFGFSGKVKANLKFSVTDLKINVSGSADINVEGIAENFSLNCSGSASLTGTNLMLTDCSLKSSGSSEIDFSGNCDIFTVKTSGSSDISGKGFNCREVTLEASGSSDMTISVSEKLKADVSGIADIVYYGNPSVEKESSGSCSIKKGD